MLVRQPQESWCFGAPLQLSLIPEAQVGLNFGLRLHDAKYLHFDFRIQVGPALFSLAMPEAPSLNPARTVRAKLMPDHDPLHLGSEHVIPEGRPGAGPTMPVDLGKIIPIVKTYSTYEQEMLDQLARGDVRFRMNGTHLKGLWRLSSLDRIHWSLRKLEDEYASRTQILRLDRSVKTGITLEDLKRRFTKA